MTILHGNCLTHLPKIATESVQMIYIDPPFFTQKRQALKTRDNQIEYSFNDKWESLTIYCNFIKKTLEECHRILAKNGTIFFHCDKSASHHLRLLLDQIFGAKNFQSEIIWAYKRWSNCKKGLLNSHQTIYFYSKTTDFKFQPIYTEYSPTTAVPVERNQGIDGFLKFHVQGHPVSIRIQKPNEDIETAKEKLILASQSKQCSLMILVRTNSNSRLLPSTVDDSQVLLVDAYDFLISEYLQKILPK